MAIWACGNELIQTGAEARLATEIAKFMGPTWGPPGTSRPQIGSMLALWTLLSGHIDRKFHQPNRRRHLQQLYCHWVVETLAGECLLAVWRDEVAPRLPKHGLYMFAIQIWQKNCLGMRISFSLCLFFPHDNKSKSQKVWLWVEVHPSEAPAMHFFISCAGYLFRQAEGTYKVMPALLFVVVHLNIEVMSFLIMSLSEIQIYEHQCITLMSMEHIRSFHRLWA